jgi:hypothetical protein
MKLLTKEIEMSDVKTGGAAMPVVGDLDKIHFHGMTLRDYFAAKAMQAELMGGIHLHDFGVTAKSAYIMADTMIEARSAK